MNAVENANINIETVKAMKQASDAMKKVQTRMGIDDVEATMYALLLLITITKLSNYIISCIMG